MDSAPFCKFLLGIRVIIQSFFKVCKEILPKMVNFLETSYYYKSDILCEVFKNHQPYQGKTSDIENKITAFDK